MGALCDVTHCTLIGSHAQAGLTSGLTSFFQLLLIPAPRRPTSSLLTGSSPPQRRLRFPSPSSHSPRVTFALCSHSPHSHRKKKKNSQLLYFRAAPLFPFGISRARLNIVQHIFR